jgi:ubiquinone/menaquinone biosynthesis C-methylase UbiE
MTYKKAHFNEKSRTAYDLIADNYDNTHDGKFTQKFKSLLLSAVTLKDNDCVLDVACGNGTLLTSIRERKSIKGYGVDISERMVKNAAEHNPSMEFHAARCEAIPFADNTMDIITVCAAYHHFPDIAAFAGEAQRLIKSGGRLYIAEIYLASPLRVIINPFVSLSKAGDVKFYSPVEIINNFNQHGFEKTDVKVDGIVQVISMRKL